MSRQRKQSPSQTISVREYDATENSRLETVKGTKPFLFQHQRQNLELKYRLSWSHDQVLRYLLCSLMLTGMGKPMKKKYHSKPKPQSPKHTGWWEGEAGFLAVTRKPHSRYGVGFNLYMPTSSLWEETKRKNWISLK